MSETDIPPIRATEAVYTGPNVFEESWIEFELEWDPRRKAYINKVGDDTWETAEEKEDEFDYTVNGEEYTDLWEAIEAAVSGTDILVEEVDVLYEPHPDYEPVWITQNF